MACEFLNQPHSKHLSPTMRCYRIRAHLVMLWGQIVVSTAVFAQVLRLSIEALES